MAKITTGPIVSEIRNRLADVVFYRNRAGAAVRAYVHTPWPGTPYQTSYTDAFRDVMGWYQNELTESQRRAWAQFAISFPNRTSINGLRPLSPAQAYIRTNLPLWSNSGLRLDDPPLDMNVLQPRSCAVVTNTTTAPVTDDFDRPDSDNLGANWTVAPANSFQIFSHQVGPKNGYALGFAASTLGPFANDQASRATLSLGPSASLYFGLTVRCTPGGPTAYACWITTGGITLWKIVSGTFTGLLSGSTPPTLGRTYELRVQGTTLTVYENGVLFLGPLTDTAIAAGAPGLCQLGITPAQLMDDWEGDGAPATPSLTVTVDPDPTVKEVIILGLTPPLPASVLNFWKCYLLVPVPSFGGPVDLVCTQGPVSPPYNVYAAWKAFYDARTPPTGTLVPGKRIGLRAHFMNLFNGALSQHVIASSLTT